MKKQKIKKLKENPYFIYGGGVLGIIIIFILISGLAIYAFGAKSGVIKKISEIIPYPSAIIGFQKTITIGKLNKDLEAVKKFYENQDFSELGLRVDFSTEDGEKRLKIKEKQLLNKLIENKIVEILAKKKGVLITSEMVSQEFERKLVEYGGKEKFNNEILALYGWDTEEFKKEIVRPDLQREELEKDLKKTDSRYRESQEKIKKAKEALDSGESFEEVTKEYSKGKTAYDGGYLGWFSVSQMIPEVGATILFLEKNQVSDIIESPLGYHIVKFNQTKEEDNKQLFEIYQIFIPTKSLSERLYDMAKDMTILIPLKDYRWNKEKGFVEFTDPSLQEFENSVMENPQGDPIFIY